MRVAVSTERYDYVSGHFGHCEGFTIYELNDGKIENKSYVQNPGHRPGYLPQFLKQLNIELIIAGGMGERAQNLFKENNIKVIVGAKGLCDQVIKLYLDNNLISTNSVCREHMHEGNCGH